MEQYRILLVDDEPDILEFLGYNLRREGFEVFTSSNGRDGLAKVKEHKPHLVVLDVMMPEMDGIETCREIRQIPELRNTLVIFLTARGEDYSQIAGFDAGADDYVTKPIKPRVLVSRVKALLRRYKEEAADSGPDQFISTDEFVIDREKYVVIKEGKEFHLPRKEFELLSLLVSRPNKVFTREEILSGIWGDDVIVGDRTIDVHVRKIRERLGTENIRTIKGVGYKYEN
ncbi:MAG TPA: response regulator transcription factor [Bacteroidales bacterium]|nr:response regulator transcription factor [Bacteroidales bacterium]HOX78295.1 response regulator transcription factor [Bacteroidales bacterium]HPI86560.1 response regulator transcription factor [Bacteroidales bacterium]HPM92230.1 response regulator transcription factor [Bacteroidales bacterium]